MSDDKIRINLVLNEATVTSVEGRVRNIVNRLNNSPITINVNSTTVDNATNKLNALYQQMQRISSTPVNINANLTTQQQQYRLETERLRVSQQLDLSRQRTLQTENQALTAMYNQNRTLTVNNNVSHQMAQNVNNLGNNMQNAVGHTRDFVGYLERSVQYIATYKLISTAMREFSDAFSEMKSVDSALISVRKTTGMSEDEINRIRKQSYGVATEYGRTASEYLESVSEFARAGYKQHSTELGKLSLLTQNVGDVSAESAVKMLLAIDAAYQLEGNVTELTNVVNALNNIANKNPTSMQKIADGLQVSASMAKTAGMEVSELTSLIGTGTAVTQREGAEVARAVRTVIMNITQQKGELEDGTIIDSDSIAKAEKALKGVNIETKHLVNGVEELRNPFDVLDDLEDKWDSLSSVKQNVLLESLGNKRQANILSGIMDSWDMVEKMQIEYFDSADSAIEENILYLEGWEAKSKIVSAKWTEYISSLADTKVITGSLDALFGILSALDTPLGRIVTQIVLINTALALTGRAWGAIRARSIVADILSMGVAERNLGGALQLVTGHLWEQARAWLATPMGMTTVAISGISLLISGISKFNQKIQENRQELMQLGQQAADTNKQLYDLISQYSKLGKDGQIDLSDQETAKGIQEQIVELVGDQAKNIDLVNGKYDEEIEKLQQIKALGVGDSYNDISRAAKSAEANLRDGYTSKGVGGSDNTIMGGSFQTASESAKIKEVMTKNGFEDFGKEYYEGTYKFQLDTSTPEKMVESYYKAVELSSVIARDYGKDIENSEGALYDFYNNLNKFIDNNKEDVEAYSTAIKNLHTMDANSELANFLKTNDIATQEDFDSYIKGIEDGTIGMVDGKEASDSYKQVLIDVANDAFPQFSNAAKDADENIDNVTASLSELEKSSDKIKTLGSAFKELSEDGYITTKTLGEIQTATGLSGDEWEEYETKLMNAKKGSSEYNQVMSELTYKILDNTFAGKDLTDVTEDQIEAVLRENGVVNASAVAHDYLNKAKAQAKAKNFELSDSVEDVSTALIKDAKSCGVTTAAYTQLVAQEIIFNGNDLDISDKLSKLATLQQALGVTTSAAINLNSALSGQDSRVQMATALHEYGVIRTANGYSYNGVVYKNGQDALNAAMMADFGKNIKIDVPEIDYSGVLKDKDKKNEPLDNYLKYAENRYKIHQDETQYINDLEWALDNLVKTEDELLDVTGKIDKAYRDLAENRIGDLEHEIEMLQNAKGEAVNVVDKYKEIQRIAYEEAERYRARLRGMGYDDETIEKTKEIQELQKTWWDAQNNIDGYYDTLLGEIDRYVERIEDSYDEQNKALDKQIAKEEALLKIKQGEYDITNKLKEAQKDIDKEITNSRNSKEYLSDYEYEKIFGEADYEYLSGEIRKIGSEINGISANFYKQIEDAYKNDQLYLVEAITAEYERQVAMKERELEIAQAKVDLEKKRLTLENTKAEKNIKQYSENGVTWVADQEKVKQATEDFIDAQAEIKDLQRKSAQQMELDRRQANIDMLNSQKESFDYQLELLNKSTEKLKKSIENVTDPLADLGVILQTLVNDTNTSISNSAQEVASGIGSVGSGSFGSGYSTGEYVPTAKTANYDGTQNYTDASNIISINGQLFDKSQTDSNGLAKPIENATLVGGYDPKKKAYDSGGIASGKGIMLKAVDEEETVLPPWLTKEVLTPEYNENFSKLLENMQLVNQFNPSDFIVKPQMPSLINNMATQPITNKNMYGDVNVNVDGGDPNEILRVLKKVFDRIKV